jgi:hypothetical protein
VLFVLLKKQNGITFTVFNNIILFSYMDYWLSTGLSTDFKQMRSYLKRKLSYGEAKSQKHFGLL